MSWQEKPVGEMFRVVNGGTPKTSVAKYWGGPHKWITPAEMGGLESPHLSESRRTLTEEGLRIGAELVPANSIILSSRAPIGHLVINDVRMAFNQGCKGLVPAAEIDTKFAYYFFFANVALLESLGTGTTFKELSGGRLKEVPFRFPDLPEQTRIVAILDEAFAGIATAKSNAEQSLRNARKVFTRELANSFIADYRTSSMEMSELFDVASSKRVLKSDWRASGVPFYRGREVTRLSLDGFVDNELFISEKHFGELKKKHGVPSAGDILITAIGTIGNTHIVRESDHFYFKDASVLWLKKTSDVMSEFVNYWLKSTRFLDQLDRGNGATVDTLTIQKLASVRLDIPSRQQQELIVNKLDELRGETRRLESLYTRKLAVLGELRQSLLQRAFSGQL